MSYDANLVDKLLKQMEDCVNRIAELNRSVSVKTSQQTQKAA